MPNNWKTYKLGEILDVKQGLAINKKTDHLLTNKSSMPLFKIRDLINNTVEHYVKEDKVPKQCIADYHDLIYSRTGQVGLVFRGKIGCIHNNCFKIIPDESIVNKDFLYWFLKQPEIVEYANNIASGSVQKDLNHTAFKSIEILLSDYLNEQKKIAEILNAIDDKIENNLAINKTLEEMAMALYKHWFVDFGPFKDGEFIESELGMIPKGWQILSLQDVSTLTAGGDKPNIFSNILNDECGVPIYSNGITNDGLYGYTDKARINEESITVSARGTIGFVCLRQEPYLPIVRLIAVVPKKNLITSKYLFYWLKNQNINGNGTTQQQLTVPDFKDTKVLVPKFELINNFTDIINPHYDKINSNIKENQTLTKLRDTLLPKLISGEVRLKEFRDN